MAFKTAFKTTKMFKPFWLGGPRVAACPVCGKRPMLDAYSNTDIVHVDCYGDDHCVEVNARSRLRAVKKWNYRFSRLIKGE